MTQGPAPATTTSSTEESARLAVDFASERLGSDIVLLDLRDSTDFTEFFVIVSGETDRHVENIAGDLVRMMRKNRVRLQGREGSGKGGWVLLDFGGFIVHLFTRPVRERYGLEKLWSRATEIVRLQ